jgi:CHASE2 domain-containing sensor protein
MIPSPAIERDIVIVACAISAGIHAALVRHHFDEGAGPGLGFLAAAVLLAGLVVFLTRRPTLVAIAAAGAVLAALLASYVLATTTGIPLLHPELEPVDGLALATKAIEALGLVAALHLIGQGRPATASSVIQTKGVRT